MMRRSTRLAAAALALALTAPPARAVPAVPLSPDNPEVADQWVNEAVRPGEGELASIELVDAPTSASAHDPFHVKLRITNHTDETLDTLKVVPRRAAPVGSVVEQRVAAVAGVGEYERVGDEGVVDKQIAPGDSVETEMTLRAPGGIGTYPMMLELVDATGATLDTDRFHLGVRGSEDDVSRARSPRYTRSARRWTSCRGRQARPRKTRRWCSSRRILPTSSRPAGA